MEYGCTCDQDPEFHRDLNIRRGKPEDGDRCTNIVPEDAWLEQGGICMGCIFGCYE